MTESERDYIEELVAELTPRELEKYYALLGCLDSCELDIPKTCATCQRMVRIPLWDDSQPEVYRLAAECRWKAPQPIDRSAA